MYCPKCGAELNDGSVICTVCGEHFAIEQQKGKFLAAKNKTIAILSDFFHSKLFLVLSIFTTILCGVSLISAFIGGGVEAILTFIFSLIAVIACWKTYSSKTAPDTKNISKIRGLLKAWRIFSKVTYILLIVVIGLMLICAALVGLAWNAAEAELDNGEVMQAVADALYEEGLITYEEAVELASVEIEGWMISIFLVVIAVILAFLVALYIVYGIMLKKAENYALELESTCIFGTYRAEKSPGKFMLVMGIIYAAAGAGASSSFNFNIGEFEASFSMPNFLPLAIGAFLICAGISFNKIHAAETANNAQIAREEFELSRVAKLTNDAIIAAKQEAEAVEETPAVEEAPEVEEAPLLDEPAQMREEQAPPLQESADVEQKPAIEETPNE